MKPGVWVLVWCVGCVSEPMSVRALRLPFETVGAERRFLGPVGFHNVTFSVEIGREEAGTSINMYPPGILMLGERVVVSKDPDRHFHFTIDGRSHFLRKGSEVYIFNPAAGTVAIEFHGLPVTLRESPERRIVLVIRKDEAGEEIKHGASVLMYDGKRFLKEDGSEVPPAWRARGVCMPRDGEVTAQ